MVGAAGGKQVVITVSMGRLVIQDNRKSSWISHEQRTYFSHEPFLASAPTPACSPCLGHTIHGDDMGQGPRDGSFSDRVPVPQKGVRPGQNDPTKHVQIQKARSGRYTSSKAYISHLRFRI